MSTRTKFHIPRDTTFGAYFPTLYELAGPANWGMARFDVDRLRSESDGQGIIVGIVDTGVDRNHPLLQSQVLAVADFTNSPSGPADRNGHGTHCAGTVAASNPAIGVAPGARLVCAKGLSDGGSGGGTGIAVALRWCAEQGASIISLSIGSPVPDGAIDATGRELASRGLWLVAAAGNSGAGTDNVDYPARHPWAIAVAAVDEALRVASFSSAGAKLETSGAGVNIVSCSPGGGYRQMSGTSMATPFVAGVLALYRSALQQRGRPIPGVDQLRKLLFDRSMDIDMPGPDRRSGPGAVWPLLLADDLAPDPHPVS